MRKLKTLLFVLVLGVMAFMAGYVPARAQCTRFSTTCGGE